MKKVLNREARFLIGLSLILVALFAGCGLLIPNQASAAVVVTEEAVSAEPAISLQTDNQNTASGSMIAQESYAKANKVDCSFASFELDSSQSMDKLDESTGAIDEFNGLVSSSVDTGSGSSDTPTVSDEIESEVSNSTTEQKGALSEAITAAQSIQSSNQDLSTPSSILTGYVFISGNTKIGSSLVAGVEGAPENAVLLYQWYRGSDPIIGANANTYTTMQADDNCDISCKVTASGYEGVLVSGVIRPTSPQLPQAFAIYSADDNSLSFYKRSYVPAVGDAFEGKAVTAVYAELETTEYSEGSLPWDSYLHAILRVLVVDKGIKPISTAHWFSNFDACVSIDATKLDTSNVKNMAGMFSNCLLLTSLDLSTFDTAQVIDARFMFGNCPVLTTVYVDPSANWSGITEANNMFQGDACLVGGLGLSYNENNLDASYARVDGLNGERGYFTPKITVSYYDPSAGTTTPPVSYMYGLKAAESTLEGFLGWALTPDASQAVVATGENILYDPTKVENIVLYPYFSISTYKVTIDLGVGKWINEANENRPNAFPSFPGQHIGEFQFVADSAIELPIDVRYGGLVEAPVDDQGRPYVLAGFAFDDGSITYVTYPDGILRYLESYETIAKAKGLDGLNNYSYYAALKDAQILFAADANEATFITWTEDVTLHAVWILWGISPTFDPRGYADFNDPDKGAKYRPCSQLYLNPDGSIDESRTTATAIGFWNTTDRKPPVGYEGGNIQLDPSITLPSGDVLIRPGYTFAGWSTKLGATEPDVNLTYKDLDRDGIPDPPTTWVMFTEATTLYAVWATAEVKVTYDVNDPDVVAMLPDSWFADCEMVLTEKIPVKEGYIFKGWAVTPDTTDTDYQPGDLYRVFPPVLVKMTDAEGNPFYKEVNPNVLYAIWQLEPVEVQYWSLTDNSPDEYVLVKSVMVQRTDWFNRDFDQNNDDDPTNDYVAYYTTGWWDDQFFEYYESHASEGSTFVTVQDVGEAAGWDGTGPIKVYSDLNMRTIKVEYDYGGYENDYYAETIQYFSWYDVPYNRSVSWQGHRLLGITDHLGQEIEGDMTCGDILSERIGNKWADTLYIAYKWEAISYTVRFINQYNGESSYALKYMDTINLPSGEPAFPQPNYEFVGWFTEPDGGGQQVAAGTKYCSLVRDDKVESLTIYAYFRPVEVAA